MAATENHKSGKVIYTEENINAFLLDAKNSESKDKTINMLLFVFSHYKKKPAEILSKIKILTSEKKFKTTKEDVLGQIIEHLFQYFGIKNDLTGGLFSMLRTDSLLSKYVCDFLFSSTFESEQYNEYFEAVCKELCGVTEKIAVLSMSEYLDYIHELDTQEDIKAYAAKVAAGDILEEKVQEPIAVEEEAVMESEQSEGSESSISLISLKDDNEIERLDTQLGNIFRKGMLTEEDAQYVCNLLKCLELLVKNNYAVRISDLCKILYFQQFDSAGKSVKFITKDFLMKVNDRASVFRVFMECSLVLPNVYQLLNTFLVYCGTDFDILLFLDCVFSFGHEDHVVVRLNKDSFYTVYNSELGEQYDDFFISLIQSEGRIDKLRELEEQYFKEDVRAEIVKRIAAIEAKSKRNETWKKDKQAKRMQKKIKVQNEADERSENAVGVPEAEVEGVDNNESAGKQEAEVEAEKKPKMKPEEKNSKRTTAGKPEARNAKRTASMSNKGMKKSRKTG